MQTQTFHMIIIMLKICVYRQQHQQLLVLVARWKHFDNNNAAGVNGQKSEIHVLLALFVINYKPNVLDFDNNCSNCLGARYLFKVVLILKGTDYVLNTTCVVSTRPQSLLCHLKTYRNH